jgi:hypothetical protein
VVGMNEPDPDIELSDVFPGWAPDWLKKLVMEPDCSSGTHPALRHLAKWLVFYMPVDECPGLALKWLREAASACDRVPDDDELIRLISWAAGVVVDDNSSPGHCAGGTVKPDIDRIYHLVVSGPHLQEFRELSPVQIFDARGSAAGNIVNEWAGYSGIDNPWVCYGSKDSFYARRLSVMRDAARAFEQIVPSPMTSQYGRTKTADGHLSQHSLDNTGPRLFFVAEFDFSPVTKKREPSIWAPLIKACAEKGYSVLDMNAALAAHLRTIGPLWITVYSGGKSLQSWFPCRDVKEQELNAWRLEEVMPLGACPSTWCRSQFVRMPDGQRDDGARQSIEY